MTGTLYNMPIVVAASNFSFMGGSMGSVVGAKFVKAAEKAMELNCPFVCFSASGGARMQEALFSLMQMAKTSAVLAKMREKGVPFISVLTDPTLGGVSASFAMLGDVNIAEPKALIGLRAHVLSNKPYVKNYRKASNVVNSYSRKGRLI